MRRTVLIAVLLLSRAGAEPGLEIVEVPSTLPARTTIRPARVRPLTGQELARMLARLPKFPPAPNPAHSAPALPVPPSSQTGASLQVVEAPSLSVGELKVVSHSPEGEVNLVQRVSATFNRSVDPEHFPGGKISPEIPGRWRWLGDQTILFEAQKAFPMATEFRVAISGTSWSFTTPAPALTYCWPTGEQVETRPVLYLEFNQPVDPQKVLAACQLDGEPLKLASAAEVAAQPEVQRRVARAREGCWVALIPVGQLSKEKQYHLQIPAGISSKEGPLASKNSVSFDFTTHSKLTVTDHRKSEDQFRSGTWFKISLSNEVDKALFHSGLVKVTPELVDQKITLRKRFLYVSGHSIRNQRYQVELSPELRDRFGQQLGPTSPIHFDGDGEKTSFDLDGGQLQLLPNGKFGFSCVNCREVRVRAYGVSARDWEDQNHDFWDTLPPGARLVYDKTLSVAGPADQRRHYSLDLNPAFARAPFLMIRADSDSHSPHQVRAQRAKIGVNLAADGDALQVWVTRLADGMPIPGASVRLDGKETLTDASGVALIRPDPFNRARLEVRWNGQSLLVTGGSVDWGDHFGWASRTSELVAYLADDRHIYRPGEEVKIKGWLRRKDSKSEQSLSLPGISKIDYTFTGPDHRVFSRGQAVVSGAGGFDFQARIPEKAKLGQVTATIYANQQKEALAAHSVSIEEFRRPEFEVNVSGTPGEVLLGERTSAVTSASYFAGGQLRNAPVQWTVSSESSSFQPAGWEDYTFQAWRPWWEEHSWWADADSGGPDKVFSGRTDSQGNCRLELEFPTMDQPRPREVQLEASVSDVNRQSISGRGTVVVHPSSSYVGLKATSPFYRAGKPLTYQVIVTDLQGRPLPGTKIDLALFRLDWEESADGYRTVKKPVATSQLLSGSESAGIEFPPGGGGMFRLEATVRDQAGRANRSEMTSWTESPANQPPRTSNRKLELPLVPGRQNYRPGEVAEILVQPPFSEGCALATITREGLSRHQLVPLMKGCGVLKLPILEGDMPNIHVRVQAVGQDERHNPVEAEGDLNLQVSTDSRRLSVEVSVQNKQSPPGHPNQADVLVTDSAGKPVRAAEVALLGVDEAILSLSQSTFQNPLDYFYSDRGDYSTHFMGMRDWIALLPEPAAVDLPGAHQDYPEDYEAILLGGAGGSRQYVPKGSRDHTRTKEPKAVHLRSRPAPLAFYQPGLRTDRDGRIHFPFSMGDTLSRFRVVALAAARDGFFGKGESSLQSQLPLSIRPSPPRFLNQGDRCQLPIVVQNQGKRTASVRLAIRSDKLTIEGATGVALEIPAGESREVLFPVLAGQPGSAHVHALVEGSQGQEDATEFEVPIQEPETTDHLASYGVLDEGARKHPTRIPTGAAPERGGLDFSASSTALQELVDADAYLRAYPYECNEQIASRILGNLAAGPLHQAFGNAPEADELEGELRRLQGLQNADGGWDYWQRSERSEPIVGLHVAHALVRARQGGVAVEKQMLKRALNYAAHLRDSFNDEEFPLAQRLALRCYAISILELSGDSQAEQARRLITQAGGVRMIPLEGLGWLIPSLGKDPLLETTLANLEQRSEETSASVHFGEKYRDQDYVMLSSERRADCVILEALTRVNPEHRLIPKLVRGLLDARVQGHWYNTQENCFALLALGAYFNRFEGALPDFQANLWLGDQPVLQQAFRGRSTLSQTAEFPMTSLVASPDLVVQKLGVGRLYYRLGLNYVSNPLKSRSEGFSLERSYEGVERADYVKLDADGSWRIKAGANVKVTLQLVAPGPRYHVALNDPLPAGLEALNPALKTTAKLRSQKQWWYEHENLRDQRVEVFARSLPAGHYTYSYYARATTAGRYQAAPARAEEMYHPETSGRTAATVVKIEL